MTRAVVEARAIGHFLSVAASLAALRSDMGLFGFGGNKIDRYVKKLTNAYVQTHERIRMMELLAEEGTDEALLGILKRFTFRTEASIVDEDEKEIAYKLLVRAGSSAILPIERFVDSHEAVYWPIKALNEIAGIDTAVDLLLKVLDRSEERSGRVNEQKTQLVSNLRDFNHPRVLERLQALVTDEDEDVRIMAMDGLITYGQDTALQPAVRLLLDPEESARVKMVLLEQLIELQWSISAWREQFEEQDLLPYPYRVGANGCCERAS